MTKVKLRKPVIMNELIIISKAISYPLGAIGKIMTVPLIVVAFVACYIATFRP